MKHLLLHWHPTPPHLLPLPPPPPVNFSRRRSLTIAVVPLLLPTLSSLAETNPAVPLTACIAEEPATTTKTAFIDVSVDGQPIGRITIALYSSPGAARFAKLVSGAAGVSYRRKEFIKIMPGYVQHAGVRSYGVDAELAARTGGSTTAKDGLVAEWEAAVGRPCVKNVAGSVGVVVRDPARPPPRVKVVARKGRLEVEEEEVGVEPNGTEFVIVARDSPELDAAVLVVGRVVGGMEVVERMEQVKTVQDNTTSPYFK